LIGWKFGIDPIQVLDERDTMRHMVRVAALKAVLRVESEAAEKKKPPT
jgi:hypothetical protein